MALPEAQGRRRLSEVDREEGLAGLRMDRAMLHRLLPLMRPVAGLIAGAVVFELGVVTANFARPWFVQQTLDALLPARGAAAAGAGFIACMALALLAAWAARFWLSARSQLYAGLAAQRLLNKLRVRLYAHVQSLSVAYFDRTRAGRIVARVDRDVEALETLVTQGPTEMLSALLRCTVAAVLLAAMSPVMFLGIACTVPPLLLASLRVKKRSQRNQARLAEDRSRYLAHLMDTLTGVRVVQQFSRQRRNLDHYHGLLERFGRSMITNQTESAWFPPFAGLLGTLAMAVLVAVGAGEVSQGRLTIGELVAALFYVQLFLGPLQELTELLEKYGSGVSSAQRIFLLLDTPPEVQDRPTPQNLPAVRGELAFDAVEFAYDPVAGPPVLRGLDLHVRAGECLALVGRTGHGKSTLAQLLLRFYDPQRGTVRLDGVDLRDLRQAELRRRVCIVLQDNLLFHGTVMDNLLLARPGCTPQAVHEAAMALTVRAVIERLPQGYDTEVGALGSQISQGQRQLVCLLRAYLADPAVLVLDEATSAIDAETEAAVHRALRQLCAGRTAIVIAHRLATVRDADRIAVIEHGRIVESGTHAELERLHGRYSDMLVA